MTNKFTVGINVAGTRHSVTVMAEDALVAALKVKLEKPNAAINYVRRCNKRGDLRHPHDPVAARPGDRKAPHQRGDTGAPIITSAMRARVAAVVSSGSTSSGKKPCAMISRSGTGGVG